MTGGKKKKASNTARVYEMSREDVTAAIEPTLLLRIRENDPSPVYGAFVVGHEGTSCGEVVGRGGTPKLWSAEMVSAIARRLQESATTNPVSVYDGHYRGRARSSIGRVIGAEQRKIGKREAAVAVIYFPVGSGRERFARGEFDIGSIEADVLLTKARDNTLTVHGIERVTGLALGNSATSTPGFAGAGLLRAVAEFGEHDDESAERIRQEIEQLGLKPSDLFEPDALEVDPKVREIRVGNLQRAMGKISDLSEKLARLQTEAEQWKEKVQSTATKRPTANGSSIERLADDVAGEVTRDPQERKLLAQLLDESARRSLTGSEGSNADSGDARKVLRREADSLHRRLRTFFSERGPETPLPPDRGKSWAARTEYEDPANNELIP
jgi:hypothetical protein